MRTQPGAQRRYSALVDGRLFRIAQLVQQIHGLAVTVPAHDDVANVVDHAAQLECGRLAAIVFVLKMLCMWYKITSITDYAMSNTYGRLEYIGF